GRTIPIGDFGPSEFIAVEGSPIEDFPIGGHRQENVRDDRGHGRRLTLTGVARGIRKTVVVTVYEELPRMAFLQAHYTNQSAIPLRVTGWTNHRYSVNAEGSD